MSFSVPKSASDTVTTAVVCDDGTVLCQVENGQVFLPYTPITLNATWRVQCLEDLQLLLGSDVNPGPASLFRIFKMWYPESSTPSITHCVFLANIDSDTKRKAKVPTDKYANRMKWMSEIELKKHYQHDTLCSNVLLELFPKLLGEKISMYPRDLNVTNMVAEMNEDTFAEGDKNNFEILIESSPVRTLKSILYREFVTATVPSILMSPSVFKKVFLEYGAVKEDVPFLFRAADIDGRKFLSFREFIAVLAVLEPTTNHGGICGELRCRYIFRFFDHDKDGFLNMAEFRDMIIYIRKTKNQPVDNTNIDKEQQAYCQQLNMTPTKSLSMLEFLRHAGELKIRGLSQLLRLPKSLKAVLLVNQPKEQSKSFSKMLSVEVAPKMSKVTPYAKGGDFEVTVHSLRIQKSGTIVNLEPIWNLKDVISEFSLKECNLNSDNRRSSCVTMGQDSLCNELLKNVRYVMTHNKVKSGNRGNRRDQYNWGNVNSTSYGMHLIEVCIELKGRFKQEQRLLDLRSPIYILGDFHGNYGDLMYFEKMFWPLSPGFCPCSILFLGDYVDRGNYGVEVVTYLFCYKNLYPNKIFLLRGNHEIREIQRNFSFCTECVAKFGEKLGLDVWENINQVFDMIPLAAVVDGKLFCCHGGIPPPWLCPVASTINSIPVILKNPDVQSALAWEIMWNDPIREQQVTNEMDIELKMNEGFAMNARRGTAHIFNAHALDRFLSVNGFSHVIRAHEMAQSGYNVMLKGKLITVFSCSKYATFSNEAACMLVHNGKLRFMRLDPLND